MGPPKVEGTEDLDSEKEDENKRQEQTRKKLVLLAQKAAQLYEKYVKNYEYAAAKM